MLTNYAELQTEIADHLQRDDLTAKIPTFIKLFEKRANRLLRSLLQESIDSQTLFAGSNSLTLPSDFAELIDSTYIIDSYPELIRYLSGAVFDSVNQLTGPPLYCNTRGGVLYFSATADQNYTVKTRYLKTWDIATDSTNWLLTTHPDCYLYGSLAASSPYIDDERMPEWKLLASESINEINQQANRTRRGHILLVDDALMSNTRYNVTTDDW